MPKSIKPCKEFQDIIADIQIQLSKESEVKSPDYIRGVFTKIDREVDVSIRTKIGLYDFLTVIECRDHKRPVDIKYIEEMVSKRDDIRANKLIIISKEGFSKTAKELARIRGLELLKFSDSEDFNWDEFISTSVITIHQKHYDILSLDFIMKDDKNIEPLDGMKEVDTKNGTQFLFNKDYNPVEYQTIIQNAVRENSGKIEQFFPETGDRIFTMEVRIHYPLYFKIDEFYRPILKLKTVLKLYIETIEKPLNLLMKRKLTDDDTGEELARYFEIGFSYKDQDLYMSFVQSDLFNDLSNEK